MSEIVRSVKEYNSNSRIIASGYADYNFVGSINPLDLPFVAYKSNSDGVLIDVKTKNRKENLFSFLDDTKIKTFVDRAHDNNLLAALAGSLNLFHLERVHNLNADIVGVRGAVCTKNDRETGILEKEKVSNFARIIAKL